MLFSEFYPDYFTSTILEWKHLLKPDKDKQVIISSLEFLVVQKRIKVYAFAVMSNHIHIIWQVQPGFRPEDVQLSCVTFAGEEHLQRLQRRYDNVMKDNSGTKKIPTKSKPDIYFLCL